MQVWDALGPGCINFSAEDVGEENLGWVVEGRVLQAALWSELGRLCAQRGEQFELYCPSTLSAASFPPPGNTLPTGVKASAPMAPDCALAKLTLSDGLILNAHLVVAADGAQSKVRAFAGIGAFTD